MLPVMLLASCAWGPTLEYSLDVPAQTLILPGSPPVRDGRARFREIFCTLLAREPGSGARPCSELLHRLSDEPDAVRPVRPLPEHGSGMTLIFVPGLLGGCGHELTAPFESTILRLRHLGYDARLVSMSPSPTPHTAVERIAQAVAASPSERIVLIGHARGAVDILEFLVANPQATSRVQAVLSVAGAINGTPLAKEAERVVSLSAREGDAECVARERAALETLRRVHRFRWLSAHPLPERTRYFSLVAFAEPSDLSLPLRPLATRLKEIDPRNDGLHLFFDQVIPGAVLLGYANADHWTIAADHAEWGRLGSKDRPVPQAFPRDVLMEAAILDIVEHLASSGAAQ
jgi:pimeloyl-ACP methyl ester carboxylesterase